MKADQIIAEFSADDLVRAGKPYDNLAERVVALASSCRSLEPEQMTDQQKLALAIVGGCEWEFTDTGVRVTEPFAIQKIGEQIILLRHTERRSCGPQIAYCKLSSPEVPSEP